MFLVPVVNAENRGRRKSYQNDLDEDSASGDKHTQTCKL